MMMVRMKNDDKRRDWQKEKSARIEIELSLLDYGNRKIEGFDTGKWATEWAGEQGRDKGLIETEKVQAFEQKSFSFWANKMMGMMTNDDDDDDEVDDDVGERRVEKER